METSQLLKHLGTSDDGLTLLEADRRFAHAGHLKPHRASAWSLLWDQFKSPIILLLFCSAVLSLTLLDDATNGLIIVFILVASGLLSFWQELSAADAVAKLMRMIETKATVIRGGQDCEVPLDAVVPGDVVRLRAGDLIPGDCRLLTARDLFLNETVLTGESFPAEKSCGVLPEAMPLGRRTNSVFLGTSVISGFATAVVVGTGIETEFGKISERLEHKQPETGFERGLRQFGQLLVKVVLIITVVVFAVKVGCQGRDIAESLLVGLALAVGMTPQLLPAVTSVVLAAGAKAMARQRVLGLAIRTVETPHVSEADEQDMTFLGFLVFADPPKADAPEMIAELRDLGVALKVITGDNRAVAATISRQVGIASPVVVTGSDLRAFDDEAFVQQVRRADVFAEVEPNQKEQILLALKRSGEVVGYLGDGINDASALHAADVGISAASAVDVAREAAQIVLLEQDLGVLVQGVRAGRRTFSNTLKYVFYVIAANFGYMFSLSVASLFLPFEPLLASQILLVNLLADFPAMALATDSVDPEQIQRPRRWDVRFIMRFMMSFGFSSSMFDFLTFAAMFYVFRGLRTEDGAAVFVQLFHTGWFVESTLTGLMILAVVRTQRPFFLSRPGRLFLLAAISMALAAVWLPYSPFAAALGFVTPPAILLAIAIVITLLYGLGMEVVKRLFYRYLA